MRRFCAKILEHNTPSLRLFEHKMGFSLARRLPVFSELHYEMEVEGEAAQQLAARAEGLLYGVYDVECLRQSGVSSEG